MKTNTRLNVLSVSGMVIAAVLCLSLPCQAQSEGKSNRRTYNKVHFAALALALEAPGYTDEVEPKPSDAFQRLVRTQPDLLLTLDAGNSWYIEFNSRGRELEDLPLDRFPLEQTDMAAADAILDLPLIKQWVACLLNAWAGKGGGECISKLAQRASEVDDIAVRDAFLANIGARVIALAPQNEQWQAMLYAKSVPSGIELALAEYQTLEIEKIQAALAFEPDSIPDQSAISFEIAVAGADSDPELLWGDFTIPELPATKGGSARRLISWGVRPDGALEPIGFRAEPGVAQAHSLWLSMDQHIIVKGTLDAEKRKVLRTSNSLLDLYAESAAWDVEMFLSRPGSPNLGVLSHDR